MTGSRQRTRRRPPRLLSGTTDLPVLLSPAEVLRAPIDGAPDFRLRGRHLAALAVVFLLAAGVAEAQGGAAKEPVLATIAKWTPLMLRGFLFNLAISFMSMAIGTAVGAVLGIFQISLLPSVRAGSWVLTQFFRNAPWLVLLFYMMFLLPFEIRLLGTTVPFPDWVKAVLGLALPVMANVSEIVRGAIQSIPSGQWESADSLAFNRRQTLWMIILPQCVKRMLPPWMNLYAILTMATVLASVVGVTEVMTLTGRVLSAENRPELLMPFYAYVLLWFFAYCYPIALWTIRMERRFAVNI
ncbi:MAG: amino acid ABC transporter permease [Alphaproteobacteria bacterium]